MDSYALNSLIRKHIDYDRKTGKLTQKHGSEANFAVVVRENGETFVYVDSCQLKAEFVAVSLVRGYMPDEVSFVNGERWDLTYKNLIVGKANKKQSAAIAAINLKYHL